MNIIMLGQKRIPSREGGVEVVVEELSTRMVKLGHNVTCLNRRGKFALDSSVEIDNLDSYKGVTLKTVPTIDRKGLAAMSSSFFASIRAAFSKADAVHFHAEGPCATLWIPKLFGKTCIATIHGLDHQRAKWGKFASKYILFGEKCAVKYADQIIVLSQSVHDYFKDVYNRETIYIPNGVNKPIVYEPNLITSKFCLQKDDYILFLGRLVPEKGIHYLIEAYKKIKTNKKLVIAGGASDTDEYFNELSELATGSDNIIFTGFVQGRMLEELYSNAYIYVLPSDLEGMPLSLLEAMSYGNCCLVSNIDECSTVVADKAVIFEKSNIMDLEAKLEYLLDNPSIVEDFKLNASNYICDKYNWDNVVHETLKLYERK